MKTILRQVGSFTAPVLFCVVFPYLIVGAKTCGVSSSVFNSSLPLAVAGAVITLAGLVLFIMAARLLILIGNGTIMPWDPTRKLVIASLFGHVRNPVILGVIIIEAGEALLFGSYWLALIALFFFIVNHFYFIFSEEPGLEKRFGQEYVEYKQHVPRWLPRLKPWRPN